MGWELRWREMILAGGALAATACTGSTAAKADTDADAAFSGSASCCNGGGDPCCYLTCTDGPIPRSYNACEESWGLCESMNGSGYESDGSFICNAPAVPVGPSPSEAGAKDGGALDAGPAAQASRAVRMPDPWPRRFASAVRDEVRHARLCATVGALGVLHPESRVEALYFAVERFVVPRLTRLGLDGNLAWKNRYRGG